MDKKTLISGGCSFTYGSELSDDIKGQTPSQKAWAYKIKPGWDDYICTAKVGVGNSAIARRVFNEIMNHKPYEIRVVVMWTFTSRYDWAMPRNKILEDTRWAPISPWSTSTGKEEAFKKLQGSEHQINDWARQMEIAKKSNVKPFADSLYRYAANDYHETYLSWKSIIWLQNILKNYEIPYLFTLADNTLFYDEFKHKKDQDPLMGKLFNEIDFTNWFSFGERMMGFNQWAWINDYDRGTTHPLDKAHEDAVKLMQDKWNQINAPKRGKNAIKFNQLTDLEKEKSYWRQQSKKYSQKIKELEGDLDRKIVELDDKKLALKIFKNPMEQAKKQAEEMKKLKSQLSAINVKLHDSVDKNNRYLQTIKDLESDIDRIVQLNPKLRRK
tara:strand:+ start:1905 stop:3056 length:1152 start_codon:yes stop_codon:yes gene_type:complete